MILTLLTGDVVISVSRSLVPESQPLRAYLIGAHVNRSRAPGGIRAPELHAPRKQGILQFRLWNHVRYIKVH